MPSSGGGVHPIAYFRAAFVALGSDNLKTIFTGAVKAGNVGLKANYRRLTGETEVDQFIVKLETMTQVVFAQINEDLPDLSDRDLAAVCAVYDPSAANVDVYREVIGDLMAQFRSQIERIDTGGSLVDPKGRVVIIDFGARGKGYALVRQAMKPSAFAFVPDPDRYQFMTGISEEMRALAIAKSTEIHDPWKPCRDTR